MNKIAVAKELVAIAKSLVLSKDIVAAKADARIKRRLDYLRKEIEAERISYGEIAELQSLAKYIDPDDDLLLQWAGVEEKRRKH